MNISRYANYVMKQIGYLLLVIILVIAGLTVYFSILLHDSSFNDVLMMMPKISMFLGMMYLAIRGLMNLSVYAKHYISYGATRKEAFFVELSIQLIALGVIYLISEIILRGKLAIANLAFILLGIAVGNFCCHIVDWFGRIGYLVVLVIFTVTSSLYFTVVWTSDEITSRFNFLQSCNNQMLILGGAAVAVVVSYILLFYRLSKYSVSV